MATINAHWHVKLNYGGSWTDWKCKLSHIIVDSKVCPSALYASAIYGIAYFSLHSVATHMHAHAASVYLLS